MKISDTERNVLAHAHMCPDRPFQDLARAAGVKSNTAQRAIKKLLDNGFIGRINYIDVHRIGLSYYNLVMSLSAHGQRVESQLVNYLRESSRVAYLTELGGEYQYDCVLIVSDPLEVHAFIEKLCEQFGPIFESKHLVFLGVQTKIPLGFLGPGASNYQPIHYGDTQERFAIDQLDHSILSFLSRLPHLSIREMSRELCESLSTVAYRIQRLKDRRIYVGARYWPMQVDFFNIVACTHRIIARERTQELDQRLLELCLEERYAGALHRHVGIWDFLISGFAETPKKARDFGRRIMASLEQSLTRVDTIVSFALLKVNQYPFAPEDFSELENRIKLRD